jgi:S-adenosylmethionine uptake transporter
LAAFLGFVGVLIIVGPQYEALGTGALMALGSVAGITVSALLMRRIGQGDDLPVYCFFPLLAIFLVNCPAAIAELSSPPLPDILRFLTFGLLVIVGQIGTAAAYARAPQASLVAPTLYTQILWGILYGFLFFDHVPTLATLLGSSLIIGAGLFMIRKERKYKENDA